MMVFFFVDILVTLCCVPWGEVADGVVAEGREVNRCTISGCAVEAVVVHVRCLSPPWVSPPSMRNSSTRSLNLGFLPYILESKFCMSDILDSGFFLGFGYLPEEIGFRFFENQFLKVVLEKWFRYEFSKTLVRSSKPAGRTRVGSAWLCGQKCNG